MSDGEDVRTLLAERPEFESALEAVLAVDEEHDTWTFEDVAVDSGRFGELVSRDVVEKVDGQYRLANPAVVRAALNGDAATDTTPTDASSTPFDADLDLDFGLAVDARTAAVVAGALALLFVVRAYPVWAVFKPSGDVVLTGNDPWFYRYHVERLAGRAVGPLDPSFLSNLPNSVANNEPLLVATLWWFSELAGGVGAAGAVLALYPVVSSVVVGGLLYLASVVMTGDRRVGIAAVVFLAVTPAHALRSGLGFADHHAFDYLWLALTACSVTVALVLTADESDLYRLRTWLATVGVGVGVAGQILAWNAGPLYLAPVGVLAVAVALVRVRNGRSPALPLFPVVGGLLLASVATHFAHVAFGWHTTLRVYSPALLVVGVTGTAALGEVARRFDRSATDLATAYVVGGVVALAAFRFGLPTLWHSAASQVRFLVFSNQQAIEAQSLFTANTFGFLLLFGLTLPVAVPVFIWGIKRALSGDVGWLVLTTYGWFFLVLAGIQMRFAGELSMFASIATGYGFVWLAARVDVLTPPVRRHSDASIPYPSSFTLPSRNTVVSLLALFLLVGGLGAVQTPVKTSQTLIDHDKYEAATWMASYADEQGWDDYHSSYVYSRRGWTRMYNYFVNGNSKGYGLARRSAYPYVRFLAETDPDTAVRELKDCGDAACDMGYDAAGFVVTASDLKSKMPTMQARLHQAYGSRYKGYEGVEHFRAVYAGGNGQVKVFTFIPGATINGTARANTDLSLSKPVDIPGASFTYRRRVRTNATGHYSVTVPYPGTYTLGDETVTVSESAVQNGTTIRVGR